MELHDLRPEKRIRVIIAAESTCELCREYTPVSLLELHRIPGSPKTRNGDDPQKSILVLCCACHEHVHVLPLSRKRQRTIVRKRGFEVRRDMRKVLGYKPKPYLPPDNIDLARHYDSLFELGSLVLNGT